MGYIYVTVDPVWDIRFRVLWDIELGKSAVVSCFLSWMKHRRKNFRRDGAPSASSLSVRSVFSPEPRKNKNCVPGA